MKEPSRANWILGLLRAALCVWALGACGGGSMPGTGDATIDSGDSTDSIEQAGETCRPRTCLDLGASCGTPSDGCGGSLSCGTCTPPATCGASYVCGCSPSMTCASLGYACGPLIDDCGVIVDCGTCTAPSTCTAHRCGCLPTTCAAVVATCGTLSDCCGGTLSCGN